jgi:hypothetical protein
VGLGGSLDHVETMPLGQGAEGGHLGGIAVEGMSKAP